MDGAISSIGRTSPVSSSSAACCHLGDFDAPEMGMDGGRRPIEVAGGEQVQQGPAQDRKREGPLS
jgi:hypothetical protein